MTRLINNHIRMYDSTTGFMLEFMFIFFGYFIIGRIKHFEIIYPEASAFNFTTAVEPFENFIVY